MDPPFGFALAWEARVEPPPADRRFISVTQPAPNTARLPLPADRRLLG